MATANDHPRILIAEDEDFIADLYKVNLETHDVQVDLAGNGAVAIRMIDEAQPSLLVLDLLMPEKDGFEVMRHIHEKGYSFPVIILTNLSQEMDKRKATEMGAADFLVKSDISVDELWTKVAPYVS